MFSLIGHLVTSIIWGVLLAIFLLIVLQTLIKIIFSPYTHSASSLLIVSVAFAMLTWQTVQMVGGFYAKEHVEIVVEAAASVLPKDGFVVSSEQVQQLNEQVRQLQSTLGTKIAVMESCMSQIEAGKRINRTEIMDKMSAEFQSAVNWFIWKRVFWILGVTIVGTILAGLLGKQDTTVSSRRGRTSRRAIPSSGRSSSTRSHRRRNN